MNEITPVNDMSSKVFDELFSRFQNLDTDALLVYVIDNVDATALVHLAQQFHVMGNEGWLQAKTEADKREIIKNAFELHRYKGTKYALIKVLSSLNITGVIQEWFEYGGEPYHFKISLLFQNYNYSGNLFESFKKMIDEYKNARSVLEEISIESQFNMIPNWCTYTNAENEVMVG